MLGAVGSSGKVGVGGKWMYKYIFFDLDGTLTQSEFGIMAAAVNIM